jgi:hypothetical protein
LAGLIELNAFLTSKIFSLHRWRIFTPKKIAAGEPQGSVFAPILYSPYVNDVPAAPGIHLALFMDDTSIYATKKHERRVLCKLQCGLTAEISWCERWNIKFNEGFL